MTSQRQGYQLEEVLHGILSMLPGVTVLREAEIKTKFGKHITGIDHYATLGTTGKHVCIQDKWEASSPDVRDIGHFKAQCDLLASEIKSINNLTTEPTMTLIFASRTKGSNGGCALFTGYSILHCCNDDMSQLVQEVMGGVFRGFDWTLSGGNMIRILTELLIEAQTGHVDIISVGRLQLVSLLDTAPPTPLSVVPVKPPPVAPAVTDVLETQIQQLYEGFRQQFDQLRNRLHHDTCTKLMRSFELGAISIDKFPMKQFWKDYCQDINSHEYGIRQELFDSDVPMHCQLTELIAQSIRFDALVAKPKYKWKMEFISKLPQTNYLRAQYFCRTNPRSSQMGEYGEKHWSKLGKMSVSDLYSFCELMSRHCRGTVNLSTAPEKYLAQLRSSR